MWRMLCARASDLALAHRVVDADDARVRARWEARYTFSATGRPVHNVIDATFELRDGLIARHVDAFDFWRWARQALGARGVLFGWAPPVRSALRAQAAKGLDAFVRGAAR
jgi:hypothetical protein